MLKVKEKTVKMVLSKEEELLEKLVKDEHAFRKLNAVVDFETLLHPYRSTLYSDLGKAGIDIEKGFRALLIQFWEDLSDREMEKALQENVAIKWFCGFTLLEHTPDHSYLGKLRKRMGTQTIAAILNQVNDILHSYGLFGNVFTFIDASSVVSKTALCGKNETKQ